MRKDRWILVLPDSQLELNWSFSAPQLEPGGVDSTALFRLPGSNTAHRSGDGMRTPGPFRLVGKVWNDAQDARVNRAELNAIRDAVRAATSLLRDTPAGQYWYSGFQGGPLPAVTPDGLGGYNVELEVWPARAEVIQLPISNGRPLLSERTPSSTYFPEFYLTRGPRAIGNTGAGQTADYVITNWALSVATGSRLVTLWRQVNGDWERIGTPGHPIIDQVAPAGARRFSVAFDQAAQPTVAYERLGSVFITRYDPISGGYVQNVSVPGVDPILVLDATWHGSIGGSDLLLFHLSLDRTQVICRVQSEMWATPHVLHSYGAPAILDRVVPFLLRYQILLSDATGVPLDEALVSGLYPYMADESLAAYGAGPEAGAYTLVVINALPTTDGLAAPATGPSGGTYDEPIINYDAGFDELAATGTGPSGGAYAEATIEYDPKTYELAVNGSGPTSGAFTLVVINVLPDAADVTATGTGPTGGSYDAA